MSRPAKNIRWQQRDGTFSVTVSERSDRPGYLIRSGFRGGRLDSRSATALGEACALGGGIWQAYQSGMIDAPELVPETLGQFVDRLDERDDLTDATRGSYARVWALLVRAVGEDRTLRRVYRLDVETWLAGYQGTTRATYLRTLRAGFRWALGEGWIGIDPTLGIEATTVQGLGSWLPYDEWSRFLAACRHAHRIRAAFVLETGLRAGEIMAARWSWVRRGIGRPALVVAPDPATGWAPKWGTKRSVPLSDTAQSVLEEARAEWPKGDAIFSAAGLKWPNFAMLTRAAVDASKVTPVTFHGLRRSAGAHWLDCGVTLLEVARLLGHQSITTTERWYAGVGEATLARAIEMVQDAQDERAARPVKRIKMGGG